MTFLDNKEDISYWDKVYVVKVAQQIGELCRRCIQQSDSPDLLNIEEPSSGQLSKRISMIRSCPLHLPENSSPMASQDPRDGKPLIILSCHPHQNDLVNIILLLIYWT